VGAPYRFEQTVTVGVISAKGRILLPDPVDRPFFRLDDLIQTDAAINPGNSGGPMVNLNGEVVGISVAYFTPSAYGGNAGIGFGIPADSARQVIPQLIEHKRVARGWLGVQIKDLSTNLRQYYGAPDGGALVVTIEQDSPAADSDLQPEDVIVAVNDTPTPDGWTLSKTVANTAPGEKVTLKVVRDKQERQIEVTLRDMPARYAGLEETPAETTPAPAGALGLTVVDITASMAAQSNLTRESGAVVKQVAPDGPAYGKLSPGDVILKLNGQEVKSVADYQQAIERAKKDKAEFVVFHVERRAGEEVLADVVDVPTNW